MRACFRPRRRDNTSIYTLDPRGWRPSEFQIADNVGSGNDRTDSQRVDRTSLRTIADETDGRAIVNRNDPLPELQQMVTDNSAYYLLGYTSTVAPRDGKFHEIQVRVKRKDVEVRARKGYWAYSAEDVEQRGRRRQAGGADGRHRRARERSPRSSSPVAIARSRPGSAPRRARREADRDVRLGSAAGRDA